MLPEIPAISVGQFLSLVNQTLRTIPTETFAIEGEVADFRVSQGKWVNFDLKDEQLESKLPCFMTTYQLGVPLQDGMRVQAIGYAKVFERFGKFSLNVTSVTPVGEGALAKAYAMLKAKLTAEGLFDHGRKRALPQFPRTIGLITSREAAAYGDFLRILGNRMGGLTILHANVHVQGQYAADEICQAFANFNALPEAERPEVIVLTRGGGSLEELHAFNDERVVRAVFCSVVPVIVGVGHERDETLCDFVADLRASTPSNAAERICLDRQELMRHLEHMTARFADRLEQRIYSQNSAIERSQMIFERAILNAGNQFAVTTTRLSHAFDRFRLSVLATLKHIESREKLLENVNPTRVLSRGYSIIRKDGQLVRDAGALAPGERLTLQFATGAAEAEVLGKRRQEKLL